MNDQIFAEYAKITSDLKELEARKDVLAAQILADAGDETTIQSAHGTFTVQARKKWTYTPAVDAIANTLKAAKTEQETNGMATAIETKFIRFQP